MIYYIFASCILLALSLVFSLYRQFQMLQQNSYYPSRYLKWVYENFMTGVTFSCFAYCLNSLLYLNGAYILCVVLCAVLFAVRLIMCLKTHKKSIKKLVFTARVKRLYAAAVLIDTALICGLVFAKDFAAIQILFMILSIISFIPPLSTLLAWAVTKPIELIVSRYYVNDAKKILKENSSLKVIGITGSFGKTTTKFILNRILSEKYNTVCTPQSFNTPMGVVRTVREKIKPNTQIFVCEMGAKNVGDIKEICDIANPVYGIITSVGAQHLDTFGSIDNVFKTKFELAGCVRKNGGYTFVSAESEEIINRYDKEDGSLILFGGDTDYRAENIKRSALGSNFDLVLEGTRINVNTKLLGLHAIYDILAAASISFKLGVDENSIKVAVSALKPTEHRLELKNSVNGSLLIDDAYNSNPVGCLEAVRTLGTFEGYKKTVITPGLIELGEKEYESNYALGLEATKYADTIILVGKNRSKPLLDAIETTNFDKNNVFVVSGFAEGMQIYTKTADKNSIVLIENDLPDNYLK